MDAWDVDFWKRGCWSLKILDSRRSSVDRRTYFYFHTELKVAVRTCKGKAIHGTHRFFGTEEHKSIFLFSRKDAKGAKFLEPLMDFFVTQTARTFAEVEEQEFLWDDNFDKRTKEHIFLLTQRRKVSQSVCVVLRSLRAIFHTESTDFIHGMACIYMYLLSH